MPTAEASSSALSKRPSAAGRTAAAAQAFDLDASSILSVAAAPRSSRHGGSASIRSALISTLRLLKRRFSLLRISVVFDLIRYTRHGSNAAANDVVIPSREVVPTGGSAARGVASERTARFGDIDMSGGFLSRHLPVPRAAG